MGYRHTQGGCIRGKNGMGRNDHKDAFHLAARQGGKDQHHPPHARCLLQVLPVRATLKVSSLLNRYRRSLQSSQKGVSQGA